MKLTPLHALARSMMVGAAGGLVLALGVVIWRAILEDAVGPTALAFLAAAVATAGLGIPVMRWSYGRSMRKAEPIPADGEEIDRGRYSTLWLIFGAASAVAAVTRSADDSAVFAGVLTGMIAGIVIASSFLVPWLGRREAEDGRQYFHHRQSLFKQKTYFRETTASSGRFDRSVAQPREAAVERVGSD
jgi:hypothetical protein